MKLQKGNWKVHGRKPCRTLKEMAEEFGISSSCLRYRLKHLNGPEPLFFTVGFRGKKGWYDPKAMRAWNAGLKKQ